MVMTDDPERDYDRYCAELAAEEDPDCEDCYGSGRTRGIEDSPACDACGGTGRERDAARLREERQYAEDMGAWIDSMWAALDPESETP